MDSWPTEPTVGYGSEATVGYGLEAYFPEPSSRSHHEEEPLNRQSSSRQVNFDWNNSTEENYRRDNPTVDSDAQCHGRYRDIRMMLDYSYHASYTQDRQLVQDKIVDSILSGSTSNAQDNVNEPPWIVFTAGVMGVGKTFTTRYLQQHGKLPLGSAFVTVDPDDLRCRLPEYATYVERNPETAGEQTQKEAGMISEILTMVALKRGQNVLVDGTLCDWGWYARYFDKLRTLFPSLCIGIIHVTAPVDAIFRRISVSAFQRRNNSFNVCPVTGDTQIF